MNYLELIARAEQLAAGVGQDALLSPVVDSTITAETIYPHAVRFVLCKMAESGKNLDDLLTDHSITITDGEGTLPEAVLKDTSDDWTFPGRTFVNVVNYHDFRRYQFSAQMDYFTFNGKDVLFAEAGTTDFSGTITLSAPSIPELSSNTDSPIPLGTATLEEIIIVIAAVLRGEMMLQKLMEYQN